MSLFNDGLEVGNYFEKKVINYFYCGILDELTFLNRLYELENIDSLDSRFENAYQDIWQHTINNDDYQSNWVFQDERFNLEKGNDEIYLKFICELFHPEVRDEKGFWEEFLNKINSLLNADGFEIYPYSKISNRNIYGWRMYIPSSKIFIPFSQRNKQVINEKKVKLKISRNARNQIFNTIMQHDQEYLETTDTGLNYVSRISEDAFRDLNKFYVPKCFDKNNQYQETNNLKDFIGYTSPFNVFDIVESFAKYSEDDFVGEINFIFNVNQISYILNDRNIITSVDSQLDNNLLHNVEEIGLKELIQEANFYYEKKTMNIAVEKIWDALERMKTFYSPTLDKKKSVKKIIETLSEPHEQFKLLFEKEFLELTKIGNDYRIRHHEISKINIQDERHYEYLYKRCLALITITVSFLDTRRD